MNFGFYSVVLYVHGKNVITDITINDGEWHFICAIWASMRGQYKIYIDGILRESGTNLNEGALIEANGTIVIGQEQDNIGGDFSDSESFIGRMAYMDIWNRPLNTVEIMEYYTSCEPYLGNLFTWADFKLNIIGSVKVWLFPIIWYSQ